jgi:hypothetical protein
MLEKFLQEYSAKPEESANSHDEELIGLTLARSLPLEKDPPEETTEIEGEGTRDDETC